jgi:uroporphyrinogen-III synthase
MRMSLAAHEHIACHGYTPDMSLEGRRILALESRRANEIAELIRRQGGQPFVAPSMRETPLAENDAVFAFADRLASGGFDMMMLMTGVGTRQLHRILGDRFVEGLRKVAIAARGPKPAAALRELGLAPAVTAPEPNTWRELLAVTEGRPERRIAVQEYGRSNPELVAALKARGAEVTPVRVYQYALPEDAEPLREAARRLAAGEFDAALFTTATQIDHLAQVAREQGIEDDALAELRRIRVGSIGPTTTEALEEFGVHADFEPSHPKMGLLVNEAGARLSWA